MVDRICCVSFLGLCVLTSSMNASSSVCSKSCNTWFSRYLGLAAADLIQSWVPTVCRLHSLSVVLYASSLSSGHKLHCKNSSVLMIDELSWVVVSSLRDFICWVMHCHWQSSCCCLFIFFKNFLVFVFISESESLVEACWHKIQLAISVVAKLATYRRILPWDPCSNQLNYKGGKILR